MITDEEVEFIWDPFDKFWGFGVVEGGEEFGTKEVEFLVFEDILSTFSWLLFSDCIMGALDAFEEVMLDDLSALRKDSSLSKSPKSNSISSGERPSSAAIWAIISLDFNGGFWISCSEVFFH